MAALAQTQVGQVGTGDCTKLAQWSCGVKKHYAGSHLRDVWAEATASAVDDTGSKVMGANMFWSRLFAWFLGEAPEGQRKFVFAARLELMLFVGEIVNLLTQPAEAAAATTDIIVGAMVTVALISIGGNAVEWGTKAVNAKRGGGPGA